MIQRLVKITNGLYRGAAPSPHDVLWLRDKLGIKKIVSLDERSGNAINRTCYMLGIEHIITPLDETRGSLLKFLHNDLKKLLLKGRPTYLHCFAGKDRTGFVTAIFKCKYMGEDPEKAIKEAEALDFGKDLTPQFLKMTEIYKKLIRKCKPEADSNNAADIVSNEREYIEDGHSSYLDEGRPGSFAPYLDVTKSNPIDGVVYNEINDQEDTRENYKQHIKLEDGSHDVPLVGVYNNDAGIHGAGPTEPLGGFIYD